MRSLSVADRVVEITRGIDEKESFVMRASIPSLVFKPVL